MRSRIPLLVTAGLLLAAPNHAAAFPELTISGFVDTSLHIPILEAAGHKGVELGLNEVELDFEVKMMRELTFRTDLNLFPGDVTALQADSIVEQGYLELRTERDGGFIIKAGKTNAPVGIGALDPPDMYQYSHGLLFDFAEPSNLTGFFVGYRERHWDTLVWVANDWDTPVNARSASAGARLAGRFGDLEVGLSSTFGPFDDDEDLNGKRDNPRLMVDLDAALALDELILFLGGNFGRQGEENSFGGVIKGNYAFEDGFSATLRGDYLKRDFGVVVDQASVTGAFLFDTREGFATVFELRSDIYLGDKAPDPAFYIAWEIIAAF